MLTLVAAVLVYDRAYDTVLDRCGSLRLSSPSVSRNVRSETNEEKDMIRILEIYIGGKPVLCRDGS
jgi:hypothetical protein